MVVCQYFLKGDCRFGDKCRYEHPSAKAKTVCSYFLSGFCRFGDKCRNEHPRGEGLGSSGGGFRQTSRSAGQWNRSYCNQNRFEALSNEPRESSDSEQTISQIQQTMKNDLEIWERSRQWPLSCYTYTKEEPSLPGLMDFSPEEIRLEAYTANAKGNADIYEQGLKQLISENHKRRHQLSKMTVDQIKEIQKNTILRQLEPVAMDAGSSVQQTSTGMLSGSGSFSSQSGTGPLVQSSGLFGAGNPTNQSGHNIFGQTSVSSANVGSLFGSSNKSTDQNVQLNQSGGLFGVSLSGQAPTAVGKFGSVATATPSGILNTASKTQKDDSTVSNSLNMAASSQTLNIGTTSSVANPSKVALARQTLTCSEQDMQAFMADSFVLGKIPECPPPLDLC